MKTIRKVKAYGEEFEIVEEIVEPTVEERRGLMISIFLLPIVIMMVMFVSKSYL